MERASLVENEASGSGGNTDVKECRFCLSSDDPANLIAPCNCKGGSKYVHRRCLDQWRTTGIQVRLAVASALQISKGKLQRKKEGEKKDEKEEKKTSGV